MDWEMFFEIHKGLPRQGPGSPEDVAWACDLGGVARDARICDAACGPGADVPALLQAAPEGHVTGVDKFAVFVEEAQAQLGDDPRVTVVAGDLADLPGAPYDVIWCAGALYFLGLVKGPVAMAEKLVPGGVLAFSEPCFFTDAPSEAAADMWDGYETQGAARIAEAVAGAGFTVLGQRKVSDAGWAAYYDPLEAKISAMRPGADARLTVALDENEAEPARWRAVKDETGYLLTVARRG